LALRSFARPIPSAAKEAAVDAAQTGSVKYPFGICMVVSPCERPGALELHGSIVKSLRPCNHFGARPHFQSALKIDRGLASTARLIMISAAPFDLWQLISV
jgi:hypothetical protein